MKKTIARNRMKEHVLLSRIIYNVILVVIVIVLSYLQKLNTRVGVEV